MASPFQRAMDILAKVHDGGQIEEDYGRSLVVRIVGGTEGWTDEEVNEIRQIVENAGSLDDSVPADGDWVFSVSNREFEVMLEKLKTQLPDVSRTCQIVIEEYVSDEGRTVLRWERK